MVYDLPIDMHKRLSFIAKPALLVLAFMLFGVGCGTPAVYQQPPPTEPHAIAKIRVIRHYAPGPLLAESFSLNDGEVSLPAAGNDVRVPRIKSMRIRPELNRFAIRTQFFHTFASIATQTYSYACGTAMCTGTHSFTHVHTVVDGECRARLSFYPVKDHTYFLQYEFFAHNSCSFTCFEQQAAENGAFTWVPCRVNGSVPK